MSWDRCRSSRAREGPPPLPLSEENEWKTSVSKWESGSRSVTGQGVVRRRGTPPRALAADGQAIARRTAVSEALYLCWHISRGPLKK